jgi:hypothetical protein
MGDRDEENHGTRWMAEVSGDEKRDGGLIVGMDISM